jgi:hypothetical protein
MAKKIKSFSVDEEIYNRLVSMFKKYGAETSISMYLNNKLKWLLEHLEDLEKGVKKMNYSIPMSYVIDEIVKNYGGSGRLSSEPYQEEGPISELEMVLNDWQESYEAYQQGVPLEYYRWLKMDKYALSRDKKFLINKETGKKFISQGRDKLMEVRESDSDNRVEK